MRGPAGTSAFGPNHRINDPAGEPPGTCQSENSIAAHDGLVVAGWNDGRFFARQPGSTGYGYSRDGGATWTDGGAPPVVQTGDYYFGDPSLTVDDADNFYFANLYTPDGEISAITVNLGRFAGAGFAWDAPAVVASSRIDFLDKEWIAADPVSGALYVTYTRFLVGGGQRIEMVRSTDQGRTWSAPQAVTDEAAEAVQASRPAIGPDHEVYVVYLALDLSSFTAHFRIRKSTDEGRTFGPEGNVGGGPSEEVYPNTVCGPPGFNRSTGIAFPTIAIDRTTGPRRGSVYVAWPEAVDFFDDDLGSAGVTPEREGNDTPSMADDIVPGTTILGSLADGNDADWYQFSGKAGQTIELLLLPAQGSVADGYLRLFCGGAKPANRAAFSYFGEGQAFILFTLPSDGIYFFRVLPSSPFATIGRYAVFTGWHAHSRLDAAHDARDIVIAASSDGTHWSRRHRVNDDAPRYDNSFPDLAVDASGDVHLIWYDHRGDRACGILTDVYYARSQDGGGSFESNVKLNDGPSENWSLIPSNLAPNLGDYIGLTADSRTIHANWADGRLGSPDSWAVSFTSGPSRDVKSASAAAGGASRTVDAVRVTHERGSAAAARVSFTAAGAGPARLDVVGVDGRIVRTLWDGPPAPGEHAASWDGATSAGTRAPAGLYFVRLASAGRITAARFVLVR